MVASLNFKMATMLSGYPYCGTLKNGRERRESLKMVRASLKHPIWPLEDLRNLTLTASYGTRPGGISEDYSRLLRPLPTYCPTPEVRRDCNLVVLQRLCMATPSENVLESANFIATSAKHVQINGKAVENFADKRLPQLLAPLKHASEDTVPTLEPSCLSSGQLLEWTFLLDLLNFCFWSEEDTLFTFSYGGVKWTGYQSMCAALTKAVEVDHLPIYEPSFYGSITEQQLRSIFRSETHIEMSLIVARVQNLHEAASVLMKEFDGQVSELIRRSNRSAQKLVSLLLQHFTSFRDEAMFGGRKVLFLKRAQIFVADVWNRFGGQGSGEFHDIHTLTMFADYRVPQCLLFLGILEYSQELLKTLEARTHLEAGGEREVEIRGCSIWAIEMIKWRLCKKALPLHHDVSAGDKQMDVVNAATIDFCLWNLAKANASQMKNFPIHRTYSIFY